MRAVIQRVSQAQVTVAGDVVGAVGTGFLVLLGIGQGDNKADADYLADKIAHLRIFEDEQEKMNLSLQDVGGGALVISQFTLYGDARKGRRPSFTDAAPPAEANRLYEYFCERLASHGIPVSRGIFQAHMSVTLTNEGPVTMLLDSTKLF
ncbi:MAG TPA: D-aminoacyl-tRNA deacylase [Armatimonadota bacterium]|nr:D-aminoacyl-tRNA deacylase [Armatimonadota bacterium]